MLPFRPPPVSSAPLLVGSIHSIHTCIYSLIDLRAILLGHGRGVICRSCVCVFDISEAVALLWTRVVNTAARIAVLRTVTRRSLADFLLVDPCANLPQTVSITSKNHRRLLFLNKEAIWIVRVGSDFRELPPLEEIRNTYF